MIAVNYSNLRNNLKTFFDKVIENYETIIVTRKDDKNIVIISLEEYNNMVENARIMSNKKYYDRLLESKKQIESNPIKKTISESDCFCLIFIYYKINHELIYLKKALPK